MISSREEINKQLVSLSSSRTSNPCFVFPFQDETTFSIAVKNPFLENTSLSLSLDSKHRWIVNVTRRGDREFNRLTIAGRSPNRLRHPSQFRRSFPNPGFLPLSPCPLPLLSLASSLRGHVRLTPLALATPKGCGGWKAQTLAKGDTKEVAVYIRPLSPSLPCVLLEFFESLRHRIRNSPNSPSARKCVSWRERVRLLDYCHLLFPRPLRLLGDPQLCLPRNSPPSLQFRGKIVPLDWKLDSNIFYPNSMILSYSSSSCKLKFPNLDFCSNDFP